jgi:hypothetical protein
MITTFYFGASTQASPNSCIHKARGNTICKHAEFINIWYDYARYVYGPKEHLYIVDNASPIEFQKAFDTSKEEIEFLNEDQYSFNPNIFLHVKRFNQQLIHGAGVVRGVHEGWKFSISNNSNYYFTESDSLSLVNLKDELVDWDIITSAIEHPNPNNFGGCIDCSNWAVKRNLLTEHITEFSKSYGYKKMSVFDSLDQSIKVNGLYNGTQNDLGRGTCQYTGSIEHGPYVNYYGKYKIKKIEGPIIHDVNERTLKEFIEDHNDQVQSKYALEYISKL